MLIYLHVAGSSAAHNTVYLKGIWMRGSERDTHLGLGKQNLRVRLKKTVWHLYAVLWGLIPAHVLHFFCVGSLLYACVCVFMSASACERGKR